MKFQNRREAGKVLARQLRALNIDRPMVIGLPRGGVPVAWEVAQYLHAPLDILVVRKIGHPNQPEYGIDAITEGEPIDLDGTHPKQAEEVRRQLRLYRDSRPLVSVKDRNVILVDDGVATGVTALAAAELLMRKGAQTVTLAVPVCSQSSQETIGQNQAISRLVAVYIPKNFAAVGDWYEDFSQISDEEVIKLTHHLRSDGTKESQITLGSEGVTLPGILSIPPHCEGVVLFAHGSGSSRLSPRNRQVARSLNQSGLATVLFDLLTLEESLDQSNVFEVKLMADRLRLATGEIRSREEFIELPFGFYGASTGAAAALTAAAKMPDIAAIVSRGGRPDLAWESASQVHAPVLLIVGSLDQAVLEANLSILPMLRHGELLKINGATHLFEEPGKLEEVSLQAARWFKRWFKAKSHLFKAAA